MAQFVKKFDLKASRMNPIGFLRTAATVAATKNTGEMFVGAHVNLRSELRHRLLQGVKVAVLHRDTRALLVSKILADHGADVSHYGIKGEHFPTCSKLRELDMKCSEGKSYFENVLRKCDVLVDGLGEAALKQFGLDKYNMTKRNGQLIVASVDDKDAFAAMNTVKSIAIGLYVREKHTAGQVIDIGNSEEYLNSLQQYYEETNRN